MYKDATESEKNDQMWRICTALATETGDVWRAERIEDRQTRNIVHLDGYGVMLSWDTSWNGKPGRIHIRGLWPRGQDGKEHYPYRDTHTTITVASDRDPKAIAREIARRFLPAYLPIYLKQAEIASQADAHQQATARTIARLSAEVPGRQGTHNQSPDSITYWPHKSEIRMVTVQGDSIRFEAFSVSADLGIQILKLAEGKEG